MCDDGPVLIEPASNHRHIASPPVCRRRRVKLENSDPRQKYKSRPVLHCARLVVGANVAEAEGLKGGFFTRFFLTAIILTGVVGVLSRRRRRRRTRCRRVPSTVPTN